MFVSVPENSSKEFTSKGRFPDTDAKDIFHFCELQFQLMRFVEAQKKADPFYQQLRSILPEKCKVQPPKQDRCVRQIQAQLEKFMNSAKKQNIAEYKQTKDGGGGAWRYHSVPWDLTYNYQKRFEEPKKPPAKKKWNGLFKDCVCFLVPGEIRIFHPKKEDKPVVQFVLDDETNVLQPTEAQHEGYVPRRRRTNLPHRGC